MPARRKRMLWQQSACLRHSTYSSEYLPCFLVLLDLNGLPLDFFTIFVFLFVHVVAWLIFRLLETIFQVNSYQNTKTKESLTLDYVACMMKMANSFKDTTFPGARCAREVQLQNWNVIEECANSTEGSKLLQNHGETTNSLNPKISFVPTITFNHVRITIAIIPPWRLRHSLSSDPFLNVCKFNRDFSCICSFLYSASTNCSKMNRITAKQHSVICEQHHADWCVIQSRMNAQASQARPLPALHRLQQPLFRRYSFWLRNSCSNVERCLISGVARSFVQHRSIWEANDRLHLSRVILIKVRWSKHY